MSHLLWFFSWDYNERTVKPSNHSPELLSEKLLLSECVSFRLEIEMSFEKQKFYWIIKVLGIKIHYNFLMSFYYFDFNENVLLIPLNEAGE